MDLSVDVCKLEHSEEASKNESPTNDRTTELVAVLVLRRTRCCLLSTVHFSKPVNRLFDQDCRTLATSSPVNKN